MKATTIKGIMINDMKRKASELEFISQIKQDGSGTIKVSKKFAVLMNNWDDTFSMNCLSISEGTWIASGINSFVVKLKP